ncbi:MAG: threonine--tRNA ligase [Actinobacteria bacterium]|nr:threonine--tRNA ligase [Actinomycetota bacterium]
MAQINVSLPDGSSRELESGATAADLAASIGRGLAKAAVAAVVNDEPVDLGYPLEDGANVAIVTADSPEGRYILRHSTAHVMAQAVLDLWPGAHFAIGPPVENGFYYDFSLPGDARFSEEDLVRIEARMREIVGEDQPFVRDEMEADRGLELFADQPFKREIIESVEPEEGASGGAVSVYRNPRTNGEAFVDLCRGPHVPSTKRLGHFKLMQVAGAYWRGDEHRPQLQRIYGTAWESAAALEEHLHNLEEAAKRDHRKLGTELDLWSMPSELGQGLVIYHHNGAVIRRELVRYAEDLHERRGYTFASTPHLARSELWQTSGHLDKFADLMYPSMELEEGISYRVKPMNCPFHVLAYKSGQKSYRDLPIRMFELGTVYRHEKSGVLHGVQRPRGFTQDDSHVFCREDQLVEELCAVMDLVIEQYEPFGLEAARIELSTKPGTAIGTPEMWERAEEALRTALEQAKREYVLAEGEGAFYGPKIDFQFRDAIGRTWQLTTIQCDFALPERFDLGYIGADNARHRPVMIHRAIYGSIERFLATLVEHTAGALPAWLSPVQARVLPVAEAHADYGAQVVARLRDAGLRAELDAPESTLGDRVRKGKLEKVPYVLVVGADDVEAGTVGVNRRGEDRPERGVALEDFVSLLATEVREKARD